MAPLPFVSRRRSPPKPQNAHRATARIACPTCGEAEGYLLAVAGAVYRVLEDRADTELIDEQTDGDREVFVTCTACRTMTSAARLLEQSADAPDGVPPVDPDIRMGPRRNRIHPAGPASRRQTTDGRTLPQCPECSATHDFFVDLEGAAYRVLEDDADTDLLPEATNLLCARCHAVFEL